MDKITLKKSFIDSKVHKDKFRPRYLTLINEI